MGTRTNQDTLKVVYMTNHDRRYASMKAACEALQEKREISDLCIPVKVERSSEWSRNWERKLSGSSLVMIHLMKNALKSSFWRDCRNFLEKSHISYFVDAIDGDTAEHSDSISGDVLTHFRKYSLYGGLSNFKNLWLYANSLFDNQAEKAKEPEAYTWAGIYDPEATDRFTTDLNAYLSAHSDGKRPVLGLLFYREEWIWDDTAYQKCFIQVAKQQGYDVIPVFANGLVDTSLGMPPLSQVLESYFMKDGQPIIDCLVSTMKFSVLGAGRSGGEVLQKLNVPILDAYTLLTPEEDWRKNPEGMNAVETSISVAMPELDGVIHGVPIAGHEKHPDGSVVYVPIPERMHCMVAKAGKWAKLHRMKNENKKIAIIFHNYPAKNSNIGSASGLDTMESAIRLMKAMKAEGYQMDFIPETSEDFISLMTSKATNDLSMMTEEQAEDCQQLPAKDYISFFRSLGQTAQQKMEEEWGKAPGDVMLSEKGNILIPGTLDGNIFLTVQPSRQYGMDPAKAYHDPYIAPTHQYLAFYYWLRQVWKADAVIHLGTHGNLEWLPGKSVGLDEDSFPDIALGDLPNVYPYHMTITGEGMIAKRRASACLIDYLPAPVADAGAYDELAELEKTLDEYAHLKETGSDVSDMEKPILELAQKAKLGDDVVYEEGHFEDYVSALHDTIEELKDSEVHVGLHVLGQPLTGDLLIDGILQMLRLSNEDMPSIYELWAQKYDVSLDTIQRHSADMVEGLSITYGELMDQIRKETKQVISFLAEKDFTKEAVPETLQLPCAAGSDEWQKKLTSLLTFVCEEIVPRIRKTTDELTHTLDALSGRFVEPGPSGSPNAGGVALLPSGRNFYGVDPRSMPSPTGWKLGVKLGDQMIEKFIADQGKYPENIGMVLWSGPNMRSSGQDIAEFLYMLGVRPVWQKGSLKVHGLEIIPLNELKRPRIDVTGRISGLFRDTLPQLAELMDQAVLLAASQDESDENNYVRKHVKEDTKSMTDEGIDGDEAWRNAAFRIFGDAPGTYGAGVNTVLDGKNWQTEDDLANVYVRWGGHVFGGGNRGVFKPELFKKRLASLDLTVKNEENHESNILSSDDYNAFHGGMIAAVKSLGGKTPQSYVGDTTNRSSVGVKTVQEEMRRVFRSESMNPKFIEGLMKHGYKGATDLANRLSISFQWDATSGVMDDWMYDQYAKKYALDPEMQKWMKKVNPWALQNMAETLLEANQRQMWNASDEMKQELQELYLSVEGELEDDDDDE